ncbi:cytochrome P450 2J6-like [Styela clava]
MDLSFVIIYCTVFLVLFWWYRRPKRAPPGPRGIPIFGAIPLMTMRPDKKFCEWSKMYGPVMSVRVGRSDWVVLSNFDVITDALVKQGQKFIGRPWSMSKSELAGEGHGLIFSNGELWKTQRKFGFVTFREVGVGKKNFEDIIEEECNFLIHALQKHEGQAFDCSNYIRDASGNIVCNLIFGRRFDWDSKTFKDFFKYDGVSNPKKAILLNIALVIPFLKYLPPFRSVMKDAYETLESVFDCYRVEFKMHQRDLNIEEPRDFIDAFLVQKIRKHGSPYFTEKQLRFYIRDLFGAGTDITSNTLMWCLLAFLHYPNYQDKIYSEICEVVGEDGFPSMSDRGSMPFTMAYLHEILRCCSVAPLSVPRRTTCDVEINGYVIPKDSQVITNYWCVHNNPDVFVQPHEFKPERFISPEGKFIASKHVMPFSIGPRNCLGEQVARMELFLFVVSIIRSFVIKADPASELPKLDDGNLGTTYSTRPFKMIFVSRNCSTMQ